MEDTFRVQILVLISHLSLYQGRIHVHVELELSQVS